MIKKLFKYGKEKAFNVSYDDGVIQDIKFVKLLNKYGIKGTFNLNSGLMKKQFSWIHESGAVITRLSPDESVDLYKGHEVASHSLTHPFFSGQTPNQIYNELIEDKRNLENLFQYKIKGFACPFEYYDDIIKSCVKKIGFSYSRICDETYDFSYSNDCYTWKASFFHTEPGLPEFIDRFCETEKELAICQIVGHSYDLEILKLWSTIENCFYKLRQNDNIWFTTTIELIEYLEAMKSITISDSIIHNNSDMSLWFKIKNKVIEVPKYAALNIMP